MHRVFPSPARGTWTDGPAARSVPRGGVDRPFQGPGPPQVAHVPFDPLAEHPQDVFGGVGAVRGDEDRGSAQSGCPSGSGSDPSRPGRRRRCFRAEGFDERVGLDVRAPCDVDDDGLLRQQRQLGGTDDVPRLRGQGEGQHQDVGLGKYGVQSRGRQRLLGALDLSGRRRITRIGSRKAAGGG